MRMATSSPRKATLPALWENPGGPGPARRYRALPYETGILEVGSEGLSTINPLAREIAAKIVYYGPGLSGKTTSLQRIYGAVNPESRGELISLATEGDRTLFFDFLPLRLEKVRDLSV